VGDSNAVEVAMVIGTNMIRVPIWMGSRKLNVKDADEVDEEEQGI